MHLAPRPAGQGEGLPHRHVLSAQSNTGEGAQGPGPAVAVPEPDGGRCIGSAPDHGEALPMRAHRGDRDAWLRQRFRVSLGIQPDQRVPPGSAHPGHQRPVGRLGHRLLAQHPIGSMELRLHDREGPWFVVGTNPTGMSVRLPPIRPVRDEAQRPVRGPGGLTHRFRPAAGHPLRGPGSLERLVLVLSTGGATERQQHNSRGIPRHVRVVPSDDGNTVSSRVRARRPEEVVPVEQGALAGRSGARGERDHTAHRPGRSLPMCLTNGEHPLAVSRGTESAVTVLFVRRRWPAQGPGDRPSAAAPSQSHTLWSDWST